MSIRKDLLDRMNYFDSRLRGQNCRVEDDVCFWVKRFGYKIVFDPECVVRHLAEERPDIPRSEFSMRSEFYVWRNTVWLFAKHAGLNFNTCVTIALRAPFVTCFRRVLGGSFRTPKITRDGLRYFPAAAAGLAGGLWGILMSIAYKVSDMTHRSSQISAPLMHHPTVGFIGDTFKGRS